MKAASFWLFTVELATCVLCTCAEQSPTKGTCKWICDTKREELISERRLINLASEYIEQVIVSGQPSAKSWHFRYVLLVMAIVFYSHLILVAYRPSEIVGNIGNKDSHLRHSGMTPQENPPGPLPSHQISGRDEGNNLMDQCPGVRITVDALDAFQLTTRHAQAEDDGTNSKMVISSENTSLPSPKPGVPSGSFTSGNAAIGTNHIQDEFVDKLAASNYSHSNMIASCGDSSIDARNRREGDAVNRSESDPAQTKNVPLKSTDEVRMILDGKDPVALGSWIGNCLFINSAKGQ